MALEGPRFFYSLNAAELADGDPVVLRALRLAREVEELLEDTSSVVGGYDAPSGTHSTRIARAMAASLVDELEALVRGARRAAS